MTSPAAETKSIGLPADLPAGRVFAPVPIAPDSYRDLQKPRHRLTQTAHKPKQWFENSEHLPNVLFLDLNMSCKNDFECLCDVKEYEKLKDLHVVMLSTS